MEMLISILAAFVAEVVFFTYLGRRLFPPTTTYQFVSLRAEREYGIKQQTKCRDSHMVEAGIVGLTGGLIACYFLGVFFLPVLGAIVVFESVWAVLTYEFRPELRQNYVVKSNLIAGTTAALLIGVVISFLAGASLLPVIIALALFWVAWVLLMPM